LGETPGQRFIIQVLAAIALVIIGRDSLEQIIAPFAPKGTDFRERIAGHTFIYYRGKTRKNLEDEGLTPEQIQQVIDAHHARGMTFGDEQPPTATDAATDEGAAARDNSTQGADTGSGEGYQGAGKPSDAGSPQAPGGAAPTNPASSVPPASPATGTLAANATSPTPAAPASEPVFAGKKLSELAGKTDDELLKLPNVGPATVKAIREAEKTAADGAAAAKANAQKAADAKAAKK
jgi:hypothetical protein